MHALTVSPDAMMTITAIVCVLVIGIWATASHGSAQLRRELRPSDPHETLTYADAMRYLEVSGDYPPGMLVGVWGTDPNAELWWWRCSLCREHDLWLTPDACAAASSAHECSPVDLEAAKASAKSQHPAYPDRHRRNDDETGLFGGEYR